MILEARILFFSDFIKKNVPRTVYTLHSQKYLMGFNSNVYFGRTIYANVLCEEIADTHPAFHYICIIVE